MLSGMIFIFAPLVVGYLIVISKSQTLEQINRNTSRLVYAILFLMGLSLAALDNLGSNLWSIIKITSTFFILIGFFNLLCLPIIDKALPLKTEQSHKSLPLSSMALESLKLIGVVGSGLVIGLLLGMELSWVDTAIEWILFLLLFLIGIQLRNSGLTLRQILLNKHGMIIALVIMVTSWAGGLLAAAILDIPNAWAGNGFWFWLVLISWDINGRCIWSRVWWCIIYD